MRILVLGNGYLGNRIASYLGKQHDVVMAMSRIYIARDVPIVIREPDVVINAIGRTGSPNVDWCETHKEETYDANVVVPVAIATACSKKQIPVLHLSSGCVFYGEAPDKRGWTETDKPNPVSFYSQTKAAAEEGLAKFDNVTSLRIRMPIDHVVSERNTLCKLSKYKQVIDVKNSVTVVDDLLEVISKLLALKKLPGGLIHVTNPGVISHREILKLYQQHIDSDHTCSFISEDDLAVVKKRSTCVLQTKVLDKLGIKMRDVNVAVEDSVRKLAHVI